jgi:hypothetical protein
MWTSYNCKQYLTRIFEETFIASIRSWGRQEWNSTTHIIYISHFASYMITGLFCSMCAVYVLGTEQQCYRTPGKRKELPMTWMKTSIIR